MSGPGKLAVQSYCFRGFKENPVVARKVKEIGLSAVELCAVHADFADESKFDSVIGAYRDAGVDIVSIGVQGFAGDSAKERSWFEFARRAGADHVSASFPPDKAERAMDVAIGLAEEYGMGLGIHNHGGRHWLGNAQMLDAVFGRTDKRLGLMLDTAWALDAGEDPLKMIERFAPRLTGVHLKDFIFDRAGKHSDVVVGTGNIGLPALFAALGKADFSGKLVLEYEGDVNDPVPALRECVKNIEKELHNG